ncbi:bacteriocin-protection protein [Cohnella faecalis]|uniref:Bacteriocin-protection protein n=1 Tax=Cohnella faecalis TaxID=2315694 RepID=A0A398CJL8_9BACL|nr:bacteriocin-protection protein [Cohnella faecalis]
MLFFETPEQWRRWLEHNHDKASEQWFGYYKVGSGKRSVTWPESVDEALCYGWIDGLRKSIDGESYKIRFTPRKPGSIWSAVNRKRVEELTALGRMTEAGLSAYSKRTESKSGIYSFEQENVCLAEEDERLFRANEKAWAFFEAQAGWYRKAAVWKIISAKKEETRAKRLTELISSSENGRTIPSLTRPGKSRA